MNIKIASILVCLFFSGIALAQTDSVLISLDNNTPDAVFLTYNDFRYNKGILKEQINSSINKDQLDFLGKTLDAETFSYTDNKINKSANTKSIWGFFQNKTLYVNYKGSFYRVPVFGSICYLVATVEVTSVGFYDPMYNPGSVAGGRRQEVREFLINFYDGIVTEFKMNEAELLISRDKLLYDEFKK
ncbi:MAG: hypothetical protein Q8T03_05160, partial [Bacteroidota bacterium]|nr:hypothetical protein [Bacteroidota bacterium]